MINNFINEEALPPYGAPAVDPEIQFLLGQVRTLEYAQQQEAFALAAYHRASQANVVTETLQAINGSIENIMDFQEAVMNRLRIAEEESKRATREKDIMRAERDSAEDALREVVESLEDRDPEILMPDVTDSQLIQQIAARLLILRTRRRQNNP